MQPSSSCYILLHCIVILQDPKGSWKAAEARFSATLAVLQPAPHAWVFPKKASLSHVLAVAYLGLLFWPTFFVLLCCITTSQKDYNGKVMAGITLETSGLLSRKVHQNWGKFMHGIIGSTALIQSSCAVLVNLVSAQPHCLSLHEVLANPLCSPSRQSTMKASQTKER